ncbi:alanyl-tRNA synthetase/REP element-mobilizing transposase RayT, partial [Ereboglobus sp. PH5-10]|uniref:alanine--tRNA ligase-related protein n=1 Tax=Ereboglobus sp. PH5-10 TaxID=2940629 RepID=UPI002405B96C
KKKPHNKQKNSPKPHPPPNKKKTPPPPPPAPPPPRGGGGGAPPPPTSAIAAPRDVRYTKRNLPHFERPWGKYHITFSTHKRAPLTDAAKRVVLDSLIFGHNENRYHLYIACVMPDHVHLLIEPQPKGQTPEGKTEFHALTDILHSIKSFTAHQINKLTNASGPVWDKESYDRLIRSESDLQEKFKYTLENPRRDNLVGPDAEYPYVWTPDQQSSEFRRDAETGTRDACAPQGIIPGKAAFELYDTYGFPLDMTELLAAERGLAVDTAGFEKEMEAQRARARAAQKKEIITVTENENDGATAAPTLFTGFDYTHTQYNAEPEPQTASLVEIITVSDGRACLVFDRTPFYAEMGGQVGDTGTVSINGKTHAIANTIKDKSGRHLHELANPAEAAALSPSVLQPFSLSPDIVRRRAIQRHHTATHLLHWALREVLGAHVRQAGSSVNPGYLRFDFAHFEQVKPDQLRQIETLVNQRIIENATVSATEVAHADIAARKDINQFFGDKYGDRVRVVQIGGTPGKLDGYSMELCGGTHTAATGELGLLKITVESAIAAGTRRIEAVTGLHAYALASDHETLLKEIGARIQAGPQDLLHKFDTLLAHKTETEKKLKLHEQRAAASLAADLAAKATALADGLKHVTAVVEAPTPDALRSIGSQVLSKLGEGVVKLGAAFGPEKVSVVVFCSPAANKAGHQAGKLVAELCAKLDGKGGGKPDFAMGGGKAAGKLAEVLK